MPYNGSGTFTRVYNWVTDKNSAINITASRVDTEDTGFATGLSTCICKDGQTTITANLPMGGFVHTGVGNATARTNYAVVGGVQDSLYNWVAGGGTADAITATYSPAVTALVDGMELDFRATAANATTTPTFSPNGLTAHTIKQLGGNALVAGNIPAANYEAKVRYNLANTRWELMNPCVVSITGNAATVTTNANLTGVITSSGNATSIASQTGTGTKFVVDTSPTIAALSLTAGVNIPLVMTAANGAACVAIGNTSGTAGYTPMNFYTNGVGTGIGSITTTATNTAYNTSSDRRIKENITSSQDGLEKLMKIAVRDFNFKHDPEKRRTQGFIAQELYEIYPEAVTIGGDDDNYEKNPWSVEYGRLTPLLIQASQDQQKQIEELKASIREIKEAIK